MTTSLGWLLFLLAAFFTKTSFGGENCDDPDRLVVCHIETKLHPSTDPCACTHLVIHNPHDKELLQEAVRLREKNRRLKILSLAEEGKKRLLDDGVSGVYLKLSKSLSKEQVIKNVKTLATELDNFQASKRANAKYSSESTTDGSKDIAEILLELPSAPEQLAKNYDLKSLNKYVNYFIITSDNLTDSSEEGLAYHPSRLMGIDDILNADSLVDLISGLGAEHEKLLISLPATALKFNLKDPKDNMPRAKVTDPPETISRKELCSLIENGVWTLERDEDLTAPYAYSDTTWLAFDDSVSAAIKAKYILLRGLAGISVTKSEADDWGHACASRPILDTIYGTFTNLVRKPRAATLLSLQDQIHNSFTPFAGDVQLSPFRIVRVVDRAGSIHVVRKEAKTEFQCSRQGYFTHPSGCNRFYRCVKFNQFSSDFTVFEYDCPAGLAFDERYEVCVWPGSLPDASACKGSSEIAPVPRSRFACPNKGYFADPENCRWFFACYDHHGDGRPPTAYEFRCPFGLVFNEKTLTCDWPWSVSGCGSGSVIDSSSIYPGDILEGRLRPTYAHISDLHVSGGRIADVDGGLVLGTSLLSGISSSGQRYSNGYSLGLANQINSAFGGPEYEDNSGAYIHDPTGDTGGEYIHEEGPNGPESSYLSGKDSYVGSSGGIISGNNGQYFHDSRGDSGEHNGGISGTATYSTSLGTSDEHFSSGRVSISGAGSSGIDNSGLYIHDSRGDTGGAYVHLEGPQGPGSKPYLYSGSSGVITGNAGTVSVSGHSDTYSHDSRGDTGGLYVNTDGLSGTSSYIASSGISSGHYSAGGISAHGAGSSVIDNSGSYIHDSRGDTGGAYAHLEGPQGPGSKPYLYSGTSGGITSNAGTVSVSGQSDSYAHDFRGDSRGQYVHTEGLSSTSSHIGPSGGHYSEGVISVHGAGSSELGNSGEYVHDSRGDTGGAYIHQEGPSGPSSKPYLYSSSQGTQYNHQTETTGQGSVVYSDNKIVNALSSGAYVHDSRGDTGGAFIHQQGLAGPGPVPYLHQEKAYKDSDLSSGLGFKAGQSSIAYNTRGQDLGGFTDSSTSGHYIHDSIGDTGGEYIHQEGPYHNGIYAGRYLGHYIHDNSGAYIHDTSGDNSKPYTHQEGPSGPSGPIYQDIDVNNVYNNQYAGQYASKFVADHLKLSNYGTINTVGAHLYQPQAGAVHTYDISKLYVQPFGYKESVIKPYQHTINEAKLPGTSLNSVQYLSPVSSVHPVSVTTPSPSILTEIKSQNIQPVTIAKQPTIPYNRVEYVAPTISPLSGSNIVSHVQPVKFSTPSPIIPYETPVFRTQTSKPVIHAEKIPLNYPEQVVFSTPATPVSSHEFKPVIKTGTVRPVTVTSEPIIPFNSVQYGQKALVSTEFSGYDYSKPKLTFTYPQHILANQLLENSKSFLPVESYSYHPSVPVPAVKTVISQPVIKTNIVTPIANSVPARPGLISYKSPVINTQTARPITVTSTPVVPLNPVQYGAKIHTIGFSTPAPPLIASHSYNPAIKTQTVHPVIISSTPTVPLSPIQYGVKTVSSSIGYHYSKPVVEFSYPKDEVYSTQGPPVISYTYQKPLVKTQPIQPIALSTPTLPGVSYTYSTQNVPVIVNKLSPLGTGNSHEIPSHTVSISSPAPPLVSYSVKTKPIQPIVVNSTPAVPLSPVQYVNPISISTPAPPLVSYSYKQPVKPVAPVVVSKPAPHVVSYSYQQPIKPVVPVVYSTTSPPVFSYSIKTKPIQPIVVSSTPAVPYNPVQYFNPISISTPAPPLVSYSYKQPVKPVVPVAYSTPAQPVVSYSYQQPIKPYVPAVYSTPAPPVVSYSVKAKPIQPIIVSSTPAVPYNPVQYVNPISISTPAPPLVSYSYKQPVKPVVPVAYSTPAPPVVSYSYQQPIKPSLPVVYSTPAPPVVSYSVKAKPIQPIVVSSTPAVPYNPVQYVNPISISTPAPPLVSYSYKQKVKPFVPVAYGTPAPPVVSYSYQQPIKPSVPVVYSTPAPPVVSYSVKTKPIPPIVVSSSPAVPYHPVQYVNPISISTPAPPLVSYSYKQPVKPVVPVAYSTPAPPVVSYSYQQPIKPSVPVVYSTPAPPVVSYSVKAKHIQPIVVSSTPAVPYSPVQYVNPISISTPAPPLVSYSYKQPVKPVVPVAYSTPAPPVVSYSYQQPIKPSVPVVYSTPAPPVVSYSVKAKPIQPIVVSSTPAVPYNPVQYVNPISISTPAPPLVSYSYKQPVRPVVPVAYSTPAPPVVSYSYQQPIKPSVPVVYSTPAPPVVSYSVKAKPIQPIVVSSTPAVPYNPVQYVNPISISTPAPPLVSYSYKQPVRPVVPVAYSTPAQPVVSYSYQQPIKPSVPVVYSTPAPPVVSYSVKAKPIQPIVVSSTPAVPYNPVQYVNPISISTPAPPLVSYSYKQPVKPVSLSTPTPHVVSYSHQQPINPVVPLSVSTPAPPAVSFSYKQPVIPLAASTPVSPIIKYSYHQPIKSFPFSINTPAPPEIFYSTNTKPLQHISFSSTPVVPLNPIQYGKPVTTTSLPLNVFSYKQPLASIAVSTPSPPVRYSHPAPFKPSIPVAVSTPATPAISYTYKVKPVQPITITSTPIVPLNRVQYVKPVTISTSAPPVVDYSYQKPVESYSVNKGSNVVFSYSFEAKPISTSDLHLTPLSPIQYSVNPAPAIPYKPVSVHSTTSVPIVNYSYRRPTAKPITLTNQPLHSGIVTTPVPKVSYSYQEEPDYFVKIKTARPVTVTSTPVVPLNPVQYINTTPRPVPVINYKFQNPVVKTHTSIVSPSAIDYYDEEVLHGDIVKVPPKQVVTSFYEVPTRTTTVAPIFVSSTPVVPLNPVQYVKQSLPGFGYKYDHPQTATYNVKGCCSSPSLKVSTTKPDLLKTTLTSSTIVSPRKPVVGAYFEENYEANRHEGGYIYSKPSIQFEEKPLIKQGIYSTPSPFAIPADVTTSTYLQRPVQTYANTVEEESYISNIPEHVATVVKQPISVDTSDEDLNLHLDIPKISSSRPAYTTATTPQQQIVEVTTVTPVVKKVRVGGLTRGGYYVRRQKVKVHPVITTTENYPAYFTSTIKPVYSSTIDLTSPTLYSTTVRPSTIYTTSSTTNLKDDELEIEDEDDARLLEQVSGQFGEIINVGNQGIIRQGVSSTTVSSLKDGEAIVGLVKKERIEGGRKKTKVVVVSKLSDFNPLLVGKLGAECSCKSNSKTLNLQRGSSQTVGQLFYPKVQNVPIPSRGYLPSSAAPLNVKNYYLPTSEVPLSDAITSTTIAPAGYENEPFVEIKPINEVQRLQTTTGSPIDATSPEYNGYGSGGLRGSDETLQGSIDCQRAGLFRHPKYCNKFYACNWDQWKKRFTLHVFNCPIHLAYDSQLGACNWPSKGPACADDNLLV